MVLFPVRYGWTLNIQLPSCHSRCASTRKAVVVLRRCPCGWVKSRFASLAHRKRGLSSTHQRHSHSGGRVFARATAAVSRSLSNAHERLLQDLAALLAGLHGVAQNTHGAFTNIGVQLVHRLWRWTNCTPMLVNAAIMSWRADNRRYNAGSMPANVSDTKPSYSRSHTSLI